MDADATLPNDPDDHLPARDADAPGTETSEAPGTDDDAGADEAELPPSPSQPVPWYGPVSLGVLVFLVACGYVASSFYADWVIGHPIWLIGLSARMRNLLGALGAGVSFGPYMVVGGVRLAIAYVACHFAGRAYGDRIYYFFGRYLGVTKESIESINNLFDKVEWLVVPWLVGSNIVATITGVRRMQGRRLAVFLTIGIVIRLLLLWWVSKLFADELEAIVGWIGRYQQPIIIMSIVLVIASIAFNLRKGRNFEM